MVFEQAKRSGPWWIFVSSFIPSFLHEFGIPISRSFVTLCYLASYGSQTRDEVGLFCCAMLIWFPRHPQLESRMDPAFLLCGSASQAEWDKRTRNSSQRIAEHLLDSVFATSLTRPTLYPQVSDPRHIPPSLADQPSLGHECSRFGLLQNCSPRS
jgi:hypothetical protein